jgi:hypothetical protein
MSENKLVGSLVLRTIDIDPTRAEPLANVGLTFDNDYGTFTANSCVVTWKNVNIRTCLGELYRKYNRFNLKVTAAQIRSNGIATTDSQFIIYMSGLPFTSGSTYSTRSGPTNQAAIGCVNFVTTASLGVTTPLIAGLVSFDKPLQDVINITVELKNSSNNALVNGYSEKPTTRMPHWSIMCDIYGIED